MSDVGQVRDWWAEHPMTYGETHGESEYGRGEAYERGTREFFERIDAEFHSWNTPLHGAEPFDRLFPFAEYGDGARVLEVGCGMGTMAMHWARHGAKVTAVDLNPTAVEQTRRRFELLGLEGDIRQADGRSLDFAAGEFDYAYSWGVLHHSPDIDGSFAELLRVVRPGGGFGVMVYHRRSLLHWYLTEYLEGVVHMERRFLDSLELASRYGDAAREEGNPHTWPMTKAELSSSLGRFSDDVAIRVLGTDVDGVLNQAMPGIAQFVPRWVKKPWARRFGWSLWAHGHAR
jgi:ubiquinone/menaquinone biosynthesis C-methylase UbiE